MSLHSVKPAEITISYQKSVNDVTNPFTLRRFSRFWGGEYIEINIVYPPLTMLQNAAIQAFINKQRGSSFIYELPNYFRHTSTGANHFELSGSDLTKVRVAGATSIPAGAFITIKNQLFQLLDTYTGTNMDGQYLSIFPRAKRDPIGVWFEWGNETLKGTFEIDDSSSNGFSVGNNSFIQTSVRLRQSYTL